MIDINNALNHYYIEDCIYTLENRIPNNTIDLVLTSPPYDDIRSYNNNYCFDFETIAQLLAKKLKPGGVIVWVVGDATIKGSETGTSFKQALYFKDECGLRLHDTMIFQKNTTTFPARHNGKRYTQIFEYMFVFSKGAPAIANLICDKPNRWAGTTNFAKVKTDRNKSDNLVEKKKFKPIPDFSPRLNIWTYVTGKGFSGNDDIAYEHPAIFPEKLAEDHIKTWTNEGGLVYDPFLGCYDDKTEVLTNNGWKYFKDLLSTDFMMTKNEKSFLEYQKPTKYYNYEYNGDMIRIKSRSTDLLVTPNHNMYVLTHNNFLKKRKPEFIIAENLKNALYRIPIGGNWVGGEPFDNSISSYIDESFMFLLGMYLSDGYIEKKFRGKSYGEYSNNVMICQNQGTKWNEIIQRLNGYKISKCGERKMRVKFNPMVINWILENCGSSKYNKFISSELLNYSPNLLHALFDGLILGDGTVRGNAIVYYTVSKQLCAGFEELCLKLGYETSTRIRQKNSVIRDRPIITTTPIFEINVRKSKNKEIQPSKHISKTQYSGNVYCVEVPNHTLYVKRNGFCSWCGNSGTVAKAAKSLKRNFIGTEINPEYEHIIEKRLLIQ